MLWIITTNFKVHNPKEGREKIESSVTLFTALYLILLFIFISIWWSSFYIKRWTLRLREVKKNALNVGGLTSVWSTVSHCLHPGAGFSLQVNGMAIDWRTPLFNACVGGSQDCVNLLLKHGAAPHPESDLASPIHEAAKRGKFMGNFWVFTPSY